MSSTIPTLLNDDGTASIATCILLSHHGFRRDLARFADALRRLIQGHDARARPIADEWQKFSTTLHGHHQAEDTGLFPQLAVEHPSTRSTIERLEADHRTIDPLVDQITEHFAALTTDPAAPHRALQLILALQDHLAPHLALEEAELIPHLRAANTFPAPPDNQTAELYAQGFAWCTAGVATQVLDQLNALLPPTLLEKLPAARATFAARTIATWGTTETGATLTSHPSPPPNS